MTSIRELVEYKLRQRELSRELQKQQNEEVFSLLRRKIEEVAHILQCNTVVVMREDTYDSENTVAAKFIYEYGDVNVVIPCVATHGKRDGKTAVFVFVDGPPVKVSLSNATLIEFLVDKIAEKIAIAKEEEHNGQRARL